MVTAPAPPVGKTPPLEEPPAPPVPKLRLDLLKGRAKKLRGRAPRGPHLRDIFGRPGPGAHRAEVKREAEQRARAQAKATRQQQPGPAAVAAGAATGPIVERAIKTAKLNREEKKKRQPPPLGPLNAEQRKRARAKVVRLRGRMQEAAERAAHENVPLRHGHGFPPGPGVRMEPAPGEGGRRQADIQAEEMAQPVPPASPQEEHQIEALGNVIRGTDAIEELRKPPQAKQAGPPSASDKTPEEIETDALLNIAALQRIGRNRDFPEPVRTEAQIKAQMQRRAVFGGASEGRTGADVQARAQANITRLEAIAADTTIPRADRLEAQRKADALREALQDEGETK